VAQDAVDSINDGDILLALELSDVDDLQNDPNVTMKVILGKTAPDMGPCDGGSPAMGCGAECSTMAACPMGFSCDNDMCVAECSTTAACPMGLTCSDTGNCAPMVDTSSNTLAAGQTFEVGQTITMVTGAITAGRFRASADTIPIDIPLDDGSLRLTINSAQIAFSPTASGAMNGVIGGAIDLEELAMAVMMIPSLAGNADAVIGVLEMQKDLDLNGDGDCEGVSLAITFQGTTASFATGG
jgi:hypothetical protein